ncbi:GIY-YIG nuclease family protein [Marinomonas ostreistagni]|uniref:GIY-YIG nuclease family protein n=1 Tax=Marinomonas ostreistagni TaxID=359209 RepID=UPI0019509688|nr:GIY-YIG nuclease family protein [Marinomonas ostreistagni]MBM6549625.1 GIY-YIG nuclease family protein [Marinomonas ostreistagni]
MSDWSVYIIKTGLNTLYTGVTTDVTRRFEEHASSGKKSARYLRGKAPLTLVWHERVAGKRVAMQLEYRIKRLARPLKDKIVAGEIALVALFPEVFDAADVCGAGTSVGIISEVTK